MQGLVLSHPPRLLSDILATPGISSSTESFRVTTPTHEYPVGLESFEHADIQARILLPSDPVSVGENLTSH